MTPAERTLRARIAAYSLHAQQDPKETTAAGRSAFLARFLTQVDPDHNLPEEERLKRAEAAKRAYFSRLALRSAQKRRKRTGKSQGPPAQRQGGVQ